MLTQMVAEQTGSQKSCLPFENDGKSARCIQPSKRRVHIHKTDDCLIPFLNSWYSTSDRSQVRMWRRWLWCLYSDGVQV